MPYVLRYNRLEDLSDAGPMSTYPEREHLGAIRGVFNSPQPSLPCDLEGPWSEWTFGQKYYSWEDGEVVAYLDSIGFWSR